MKKGETGLIKQAEAGANFGKEGFPAGFWKLFLSDLTFCR